MAFTADPPADDDPLLAFDPVPHKRPRRNSITPDKQRKFIATLAATGIVTQAAKSIGVSMEAIYKLRQRPGAEGFRAAWEAALDRGISRLEDCALQRAMEGEERPVVSGGKWLGSWRRFDNSLLMFLLRHRLPARYAGDVGPGHPLYERIRRDVLAELAADEAEDEAQVLEELDAMIDRMRSNSLAARELFSGEEGD